MPAILSPKSAAKKATIRKLTETGSTTLPVADVVEQKQKTPLFHVVLLDDNEHTYDYVIEMLKKLFCFSTAEAFHHAVEVDTKGRTIVITCERPEAEFARDQIHGFGADPRMSNSQGSMTAILEPAAQ